MSRPQNQFSHSRLSPCAPADCARLGLRTRFVIASSAMAPNVWFFRMTLVRFRPRAGLVLAVCLMLGCKDQGEVSRMAAKDNAAYLAELTAKDIGELERGLPEGAKRLGALLGAEGALVRDPLAVRRAMQKVQREVADLTVAKSTFFALADERGIALRNNLEPDVMAGKDLTQVFGALKDPEPHAFFTTTGQFPEATAGPRPDWTWMAASPVIMSGKLRGFFVSGWSYRSFAHHLQTALLSEMKSKLLAAKDTGKLPILYVAVFDATGVYTERQAPELNEKALADLKLVEQTQQGVSQGVLKLTGRSFGWAAARTPLLGKEAGVVVLRSEI
jgi:hypothetical protein